MVEKGSLTEGGEGGGGNILAEVAGWVTGVGDQRYWLRRDSTVLPRTFLSLSLSHTTYSHLSLSLPHSLSLSFTSTPGNTPRHVHPAPASTSSPIPLFFLNSTPSEKANCPEKEDLADKWYVRWRGSRSYLRWKKSLKTRIKNRRRKLYKPLKIAEKKLKNFAFFAEGINSIRDVIVIDRRLNRFCWKLFICVIVLNYSYWRYWYQFLLELFWNNLELQPTKAISIISNYHHLRI